MGLRYGTTSLADEGLLPFGEPLRIDPVVVPDDQRQQHRENHGGNRGVRRQSRRGNGCRVPTSRVDVKDQPAPAYEDER